MSVPSRAEEVRVVVSRCTRNSDMQSLAHQDQPFGIPGEPFSSFKSEWGQVSLFYRSLGD